MNPKSLRITDERIWYSLFHSDERQVMRYGVVYHVTVLDEKENIIAPASRRHNWTINTRLLVI
jgi:hypothetical protein